MHITQELCRYIGASLIVKRTLVGMVGAYVVLYHHISREMGDAMGKKNEGVAWLILYDGNSYCY